MWSNNDGMDPNWKPDYTPQENVVGTLKEEIARLKEENRRLYHVADEARNALPYLRQVNILRARQIEAALESLKINKKTGR